MRHKLNKMYYDTGLEGVRKRERERKRRRMKRELIIKWRSLLENHIGVYVSDVFFID